MSTSLPLLGRGSAEGRQLEESVANRGDQSRLSEGQRWPVYETIRSTPFVDPFPQKNNARRVIYELEKSFRELPKQVEAWTEIADNPKTSATERNLLTLKLYSLREEVIPHFWNLLEATRTAIQAAQAQTSLEQFKLRYQSAGSSGEVLARLALFADTTKAVGNLLSNVELSLQGLHDELIQETLKVARDVLQWDSSNRRSQGSPLQVRALPDQRDAARREVQTQGTQLDVTSAAMSRTVDTAVLAALLVRDGYSQPAGSARWWKKYLRPSESKFMAFRGDITRKLFHHYCGMIVGFRMLECWWAEVTKLCKDLAEECDRAVNSPALPNDAVPLAEKAYAHLRDLSAALDYFQDGAVWVQTILTDRNLGLAVQALALEYVAMQGQE